MALNVYLLNRTYIAQDSSTGLTAYGTTEQKAMDKLNEHLADYWEKKRVIVPVTTHKNDDPGMKHKSLKLKRNP